MLHPSFARRLRERRERALVTDSREVGHTGRLAGLLPSGQRRRIELAYFGGLTFPEMSRLVWLPLPSAA